MQHLHPTIAAAQPERQAEQARALAHYGPMAMDALVAPKRRRGDAKAVGAHTPGPWSLYDARPDGAEAIYINAGPAFLGTAHVAPLREDEGCANARLIAAAPDLLEAGIAAAGALQGAADALRMSGHPRTADKLLEMALPLLRALKKATVPA